MAAPRYRRVLLKLSGEALMGGSAYGIDRATLDGITDQIAEAHRLGVALGVVIGGGNIFRGISPGAAGMDRVQADTMGMLATVINALALQDALVRAGVPTSVQSALPVGEVVEPYNRARALARLAAGEVVVFGAGTGNPFFTTDTAAALRGIEMNAEVVLKATKVDGVYDDDPRKNPAAVRFKRLSFDEAIARNLGVMDATAFALCRSENMPLVVFSIFKPGALVRVLCGEDEGTLVTVH